MPVYEYICKACGHQFEREQRITESPIKKCPSCGALKARRQISRTSFVLKGGGWYSDLYGAAPPAKTGTDDVAAPADAKTKPASEAAEPKSAPESALDASASDASAKSDAPGKPPKRGGKGKKAAA